MLAGTDFIYILASYTTVLPTLWLALQGLECAIFPARFKLQSSAGPRAEFTEDKALRHERWLVHSATDTSQSIKYTHHAAWLRFSPRAAVSKPTGGSADFSSRRTYALIGMPKSVRTLVDHQF